MSAESLRQAIGDALRQVHDLLIDAHSLEVALRELHAVLVRAAEQHDAESGHHDPRD